MKRTRLFVRGFKSIGIVDEPACEGSEIIIAKRQAMPDEAVTDAEIRDIAAEAARAGDTKMQATCRRALAGDAAARAAVQRVMNSAAHKRDHTIATEENPMSKKTETSAATPTVEELTATVADLTAKLEAKDAELVTAKAAAATAPPSDEEVLKSLDGPAKELVLKAQADAKAAGEKAEKAQQVADEERAIRETGEYITVAKSLERIVGKAEDFGPVLRRIERNEGTAEDHTRLREVLVGAEKIATDSKLFSAIGRDGASEGGNAREEVRKAASTLRATKPELTEAQAFIAALDANPELAQRYRAEQAH